MKKDNPLGLTPEELAELEAFDAEVDQDDELTRAELVEAHKRDREHKARHYDNRYASQREYNRTHKEQRRVQARKDYWNNPEKHREVCRRWAKNHREHRRAYARAYHAENKDKRLALEEQNVKIWGPYGQIIRAARKARGWSQEDVGRMMGTNGQNVSKMEIGKRQIDWERFQAILPEIGPRPEGYPELRGPGRLRQWKGETA